MPRHAPASVTRHPYRYGAGPSPPDQTPPDQAPAGADNPDPPPSPRVPPAPADSTVNTEGPASGLIRIPRKNPPPEAEEAERASDRDPPGQHVGAVGRVAAQPERALRDRVDREAADLVHFGRADLACPGMDLQLALPRREKLAEQRVPGDLELHAQVGRGEGERPDRGRLGPHHRGLKPVLVGVVGELRQLGIDVMPGESVPARLDEPRGNGLTSPQRLAQGP